MKRPTGRFFLFIDIVSLLLSFRWSCHSERKRRI